MSRLLRYFAVGAAAASVDLALFAYFARYRGYDYLVVGFFTFIAATAVNYALGVRFVFESGVRFARRHEIPLVFAVSAVGLLLNQLALFIAVAMLHVELLVSKVAATALVFGWNYLVRSHFVFRAQP